MAKFDFKDFLERMNFKYKLSVLNENTLGEVWHIRVTRMRVFLLSFLLIVVLFVLFYFLLFNTPLKRLTPGYMDTEIQAKMINESLKVDSMQSEIEKQRNYITTIVSLMKGDFKIDDVKSMDSILQERETFIGKTKREKAFDDNFENEEKYNLSVLDASKPANADVMFFCPPTNGIVEEHFQLKRHYGIDLVTAPYESVVAVAEGTVIFAGYTIDDGYIIQVQHNNNFVSIYKNNSELLKKTGDHVLSGEAIALAGESHTKKQSSSLHFELWQSGTPQNPENFIIF
ncbi:peptidase M23 [Bacteroidia bacterium]|nr:peptidase M23 [Bacteroidia bacterium]